MRAGIAGLRGALVAAGFLLLQGDAFVPGGIASTPHAQKLPAASGIPGITRASMPSFPARGQARPPAWTMKLQGAPPITPVETPLEALAVVDNWAQYAAAAATQTGDWEVQQIAKDAKDALSVMHRDIEEGIPMHVFALATGNGSGDIQAVATVTTEMEVDFTWGVGAQLAAIRGLVARPGAMDPKLLTAQLVRMVERWAADGHVTVLQGAELTKYYTRIGHTPDDMVYDMDVEEPPWGKFRMLALKHTHAPSEDDSLDGLSDSLSDSFSV